MDRAAGGGRRGRRGGRGFGAATSVPGRNGAVAAGRTLAAWRPTPDLGRVGGGRGSGERRGTAEDRNSAAGRQRGGGTWAWRPRRPQAPAPATTEDPRPASRTPLDDDDILGQILLRLPPLPSSLPRAALVCRRWRRLVSDPHFLGSLRAHHRKAPLLGFLCQSRGRIGFTSVLDPPDRVPAAGFSLRLHKSDRVLGCRHGRVLVSNGKRPHFLVWDPVSGDQHLVGLPPAYGVKKYLLDAAVICAASDHGHVHGACHSFPFQVILLGRCGEENFVCVYSSESGTWGDVISITWPSLFDPDDFDCCNTMVGTSIYWLLSERRLAILKFDLCRQRLATIELPQEAVDLDPDECECLITSTEGGELGFLVLSGFNVQVWQRKARCDGVDGWVLTNTVDLDSLLPLKHWAYTFTPVILGLAEDQDVMFILTGGGVLFMVRLGSGQFKKIHKKMGYYPCYPFTSFYTAGMGIGGGHD